jgi:hypothetical protein
VPTTPAVDRLLRALVDGEVELIVVGGAAGLLHGAPIATYDLDIVHRRTDVNIAKLLDVLASIGAHHRPDPARRRIAPTAAILRGTGHVLLDTEHGPLDALCELAPGEGFEQLLPRTEVVTDGEISVRVLTLPALIEIKERTGRAKDRLMLAALIATFEERCRSGDR